MREVERFCRLREEMALIEGHKLAKDLTQADMINAELNAFKAIEDRIDRDLARKRLLRRENERKRTS